MVRRLDPSIAESTMRAAGLDPLEPYSRSSRAWKCRCLACGNEVSPSYSSVRSGQGGCKFCARQRTSERQRLSHDEACVVMRENGYEPLDPYPGNQVPWRCLCSKCGNEIYPTRNKVADTGLGCKFCWEDRRGSARRISQESAVAIMQAAGLEPLEEYVRSGDPWKCRHTECGRIVFPRLNTVQQGNGGCRPCSFQKTAEGLRLPQQDAIERLRDSGFEPLDPYPGGKRPWRSIHIPCGTECEPKLANIVTYGGGCPVCATENRSSALRMDEGTAAEIMLNAGLKPTAPYVNTATPWPSICLKCGSAVSPRLGSIRSGQGGCKKCAAIKFGLSKRYSDDFAVAEARARGYEPLEPYPGAMELWTCRHVECGRTVEARLNSLMADKGCCMACGIASRAETNRYTADEAVAIMKTYDLEPIVPYPGYMEKWKCIHKPCGREVSPTFWYVKHRESGCKYCSNKGLDYSAPGILYLMANSDYFAAKIGITTSASRTDRIAAHVRNGWHLITTWDFATAEEAEQIETQVLRWWRDELAAPIALTKEQMPSGWTETASRLFVDIDETIEFVQITSTH